eukprot:354069-Chlamydomonas_euryale.AAC.11
MSPNAWTTDKFENLAAMLSAPMPRVWDYTSHDDTVEALSPEGVLGAGIDAAGLVQLQRAMRTKAGGSRHGHATGRISAIFQQWSVTMDGWERGKEFKRACHEAAMPTLLCWLTCASIEESKSQA